MINLSKKLILTFVAIGLLWGFQSSASSDLFLEKSEIIDVSPDQNNSEKENCELEDLQFLHYAAFDLKILKVSLRLKNKDQTALQENFFTVPKSPPNC